MLIFPKTEIHFEPMDPPDLHVYIIDIIVVGLRYVKFLVTLTSFHGHSHI